MTCNFATVTIDDIVLASLFATEAEAELGDRSFGASAAAAPPALPSLCNSLANLLDVRRQQPGGWNQIALILKSF